MGPGCLTEVQFRDLMRALKLWLIGAQERESVLLSTSLPLYEQPELLTFCKRPLLMAWLMIRLLTPNSWR